MDVFLYFQEHVENLLSAFYSCATNDSIPKIIKDMDARTVAETNILIHYLTAKGWTEKPPMMNNELTECARSLSLVEAASLQDHLTYRYDTMYFTCVFASVVHDIDFQVALELGLNRLNKQIASLEKKLKKYFVPFPKRPTKFTLSLGNIRFFEDDTVFRTLDAFMQSAGPSTPRHLSKQQ